MLLLLLLVLLLRVAAAIDTVHIVQFLLMLPQDACPL